MSVEPTTRTLELSDARITYDVRGPLPTADGRPVLLMIGQPMEASGFTALASHFDDRTVVTYDPRGLGRSTRSDGRTDNDPAQHAADLHALVEELAAGRVEVFGSSGGAVDGLALVQAHPDGRGDPGGPRATAHTPAARRGPGQAGRAGQRAGLPGGRVRGRHGPLHRLHLVGGADHRGAPRRAGPRPGDVRVAHRGRRQPRRPPAVGCLGGRRRVHPGRAGAAGDRDARRGRGRRGVGPAGHRPVRRCSGRTGSTYRW